MARQVVVKGLAVISVGTGTANAYEELGTTENGVTEDPQGYYLEVKNDENGGDSGPPVEIQWMGETARITLSLTKFDPAVAAKVEAMCKSKIATPGTPAAAGTLMFASSDANTLLLKIGCVGNLGRIYGRAIPRDGISMNFGTRFSTFNVTFECHKDSSGVLWAAETGNP